MTRFPRTLLLTLLFGIVPAHAATLNVTANAPDVLNGANASCSLREAITNINNSAATYADCANTGAAYGTGDTINIPAGTYTTTLVGAGEGFNATGDYDINRSVAITGAGAGASIINSGGMDRVFDITGAYTVSISGVTITGGNTAAIGAGGGIQNLGTLTVTNSIITGNGADDGGGISNGGTLTVTNSTITGNTATNWGGGIVSWSPLTVTNSTISSNTALLGGGILSGSALTVTNSTITGNTATTIGGGIYNGGGALTVTNSTIVRNTAPAGQGGGYNRVAGTGAFTNSIVADNGVGLDCVGALTDSGGNIDSDGNCGTFTQNAAMVQGTGFSALASNGGPTQTHALLAGSAAIDTAPACAGLITDQRGTARPQGSACDIGAYEYVPVVVAASGIPTLSEWGMILLSGLLALFGLAQMRRRGGVTPL